MKTITAAVLLACAALGACAAPADSTDPAATLAELRAIGRDASCTSNQQCKTVALGAKPCGGPEAWLAWSSAKADPARVAKLGERYKLQRKAQHDKMGVVGDCSMVVDPGASCQVGKCQLNSTPLVE